MKTLYVTVMYMNYQCYDFYNKHYVNYNFICIFVYMLLETYILNNGCFDVYIHSNYVFLFTCCYFCFTNFYEFILTVVTVCQLDAQWALWLK